MGAKVILRFAVALAAVAVALATIQSRAASPPPPPAGQPETAEDFFDARAIHFKNGCAAPIEAAIRFQTVNGAWTVSSWIALKPEETRKVAWTRAPVFYSAMRRPMPGEGESEPPKNGLWAQVPGDAKPTAFARRPLGERLGGDVTQVFFCPR